MVATTLVRVSSRRSDGAVCSTLTHADPDLDPPQTPPTTGQLGLGTRENSWRPQEVKGLLSKTIVQISAGCYHTLALDDGGNCWAAGRNNHCAFWVWFVGLVIWLSGWGCVWSAHIMTCPTTTTTTTPQ